LVCIDAERSPFDAKPGSLDPSALLDSWTDPKGLTLIGDAKITNSLIHGWKRIWNDNRADHIVKLYDQPAAIEAPVNSLCRGLPQINGYFADMMSSFPEREFKAHHAIVRCEPQQVPIVALRWNW